MQKNNNKFVITLAENGLHSLKKGITSFKDYQENNSVWFLKDAIIFFHNGIELLMKQVLVQQSEYLIFEDLGGDTIKKIKQAQNANINVFLLPKPPKTITFLDAIRRVEVIVKPQELTEPIISHLENLNALRNSLEHYALDEDIEKPEKILRTIETPLIDLFTNKIPQIRAEFVSIKNDWDNLSNNSLVNFIIKNGGEAGIGDFIKNFIGEDLKNVPSWEFIKQKDGISIELDKLIEKGVIEPSKGGYRIKH